MNGDERMMKPSLNVYVALFYWVFFSFFYCDPGILDLGCVGGGEARRRLV